MTVRSALDAALDEPEDQEAEPVDELDDGLAFEEEEARTDAPGSVLAALRARAAQLQTEQTVDLAIPGYGEQLWGRYHAVSLPRALAQANVVNPIVPTWTMAADVLGRALDALYYRDEAGELLPLYPPPIRFDDDLVEMFGLHPHERTSRAVLLALCGGGEKAESLVWTHYMAYQGWLMTGGDENEPLAQEVADSAVGEYRPD